MWWLEASVKIAQSNVGVNKVSCFCQDLLVFGEGFFELWSPVYWLAAFNIWTSSFFYELPGEIKHTEKTAQFIIRLWFWEVEDYSEV